MARTAAVPAFIGWTAWQVQAGWLLRAHRVCHADPVLHRVTGFARVYSEGRIHAGGVSSSSVSRWETGRVPVTAAAVRRYEDVLGLSPHRLLAPIQTIARHEGGPTADLFLRGGEGTRPLEASVATPEPLLDRVLDSGVLTGTDWDDLTRWAAYGSGRVSPGRVRHLVARRLLEETLVASGVSWMRRFEALNRLLADPLWGPETIAACTEIAEQPEHAGLIEVVCALDASPHPDAGRGVLRQLTDPTTADTQYGALLAAARKVRKHHFTASQTRTLVEVVDGVLTGPRLTHSSSITEAATVLLHRLPLSAAYAARLTASAAEQGPTARSIVTHGSIADPSTAAVTVARVLARLDDDTPAHPADVLDALVDDLLHHPIADARLYAAMMLNASPYGARIAAALAAELRRPETARSEARAVPLLHALRVLGGPGQRARVAELTLAPGLPKTVSIAAVHALAHIEGHSPESYWRAVFHQNLGAAHGAAEQHHVLKRLVYGFAMAGELDLLMRLVAEQRPRAVRAAHFSQWWTSLDRHVRDSARH
ncbi:helix-turn-helix domain-containing protein [Streptomyces sp. IBSBF 2435]|uniref:helix-turn-helix domain-containing protein n=1 Tax=Streptomyces sp. IBSBF 2435 TaxID=2903531 RepID=UPI002FDBE434